jgi:hypothetical protein
MIPSIEQCLADKYSKVILWNTSTDVISYKESPYSHEGKVRHLTLSKCSVSTDTCPRCGTDEWIDTTANSSVPYSLTCTTRGCFIFKEKVKIAHDIGFFTSLMKQPQIAYRASAKVNIPISIGEDMSEPRDTEQPLPMGEQPLDMGIEEPLPLDMGIEEPLPLDMGNDDSPQDIKENKI